jgi:enterochelin esterase family protein
MSPASVIESRLVFTAADPDRDLRLVQLECDEAISGTRRFRRTRDGWILAIPRPALQRVEYQYLLVSGEGTTAVMPDPGSRDRVATAFGERSVVLMPGYRRPAWSSGTGAPGRRPGTAGGTRAEMVVSAEPLGSLPVEVWSPPGLPDDKPAPLLVVHDGPEMVTLAALDVYASAMVSGGVLPPFRMMLCTPVHRDEWYAANDAYLAAELVALDHVAHRYATRLDQVVAMGASLGGLTSLLLAMGDGFDFAGALCQSGSFFKSDLDPQESSYPWFEQIVERVRTLPLAAAGKAPRPVALSCGVLEENAANNRAMADRLRAAGHDVRYLEVADLHNYTAWRDAWDPLLTDLLRDCWLRTP